VIILHDFTYPTPAALGWAWEFYMQLMWLVGGLIYPQWARTFRELPILIRQTKWVEEAQTALRAEGFSEVRQQRLTLGGAALVTARLGSGLVSEAASAREKEPDREA
jgi:demethylmenaquinone methyltransferase/2-methoxy-6-polyprenyl-1,4-benzoquinol methylase